MAEDLTAVVAMINARHGMRYRLGDRFADGVQTGAWQLTDPDAGDAVLKWAPRGGRFLRPEVRDAVNRIRRHGYPTPEWLAVGEHKSGRYVVQERVPGEKVELTAELVPNLVDVLERQAGLGPTELDRDWSAYVYDEAWADASSVRGYLRDLGAIGGELVEHFDRALRRHRPPRMPVDDLVHGDFITDNLLIDAAGGVQVVDIEALGHGTRVVDYAWLLREEFGAHGASEAAGLLRATAERIAGPAVLATCVTATALDVVRFVHLRWPENTAALIGTMHGLADYLLS